MALEAAELKQLVSSLGEILAPRIREAVSENIAVRIDALAHTLREEQKGALDGFQACVEKMVEAASEKIRKDVSEVALASKELSAAAADSCKAHIGEQISEFGLSLEEKWNNHLGFFKKDLDTRIDQVQAAIPEVPKPIPFPEIPEPTKLLDKGELTEPMLEAMGVVVREILNPMFESRFAPVHESVDALRGDWESGTLQLAGKVGSFEKSIIAFENRINEKELVVYGRADQAVELVEKLAIQTEEKIRIASVSLNDTINTVQSEVTELVQATAKGTMARVEEQHKEIHHKISETASSVSEAIDNVAASLNEVVLNGNTEIREIVGVAVSDGVIRLNETIGIFDKKISAVEVLAKSAHDEIAKVEATLDPEFEAAKKSVDEELLAIREQVLLQSRSTIESLRKELFIFDEKAGDATTAVKLQAEILANRLDDLATQTSEQIGNVSETVDSVAKQVVDSTAHVIEEIDKMRTHSSDTAKGTELRLTAVGETVLAIEAKFKDKLKEFRVTIADVSEKAKASSDLAAVQAIEFAQNSVNDLETKLSEVLNKGLTTANSYADGLMRTATKRIEEVAGSIAPAIKTACDETTQGYVDLCAMVASDVTKANIRIDDAVQHANDLVGRVRHDINVSEEELRKEMQISDSAEIEARSKAVLEINARLIEAVNQTRREFDNLMGAFGEGKIDTARIVSNLGKDLHAVVAGESEARIKDSSEAKVSIGKAIDQMLREFDKLTVKFGEGKTDAALAESNLRKDMQAVLDGESEARTKDLSTVKTSIVEAVGQVQHELDNLVQAFGESKIDAASMCDDKIESVKVFIRDFSTDIESKISTIYDSIGNVKVLIDSSAQAGLQSVDDMRKGVTNDLDSLVARIDEVSNLASGAVEAEQKFRVSAVDALRDETTTRLVDLKSAITTDIQAFSETVEKDITNFRKEVTISIDNRAKATDLSVTEAVAKLDTTTEGLADKIATLSVHVANRCIELSGDIKQLETSAVNATTRSIDVAKTFTEEQIKAITTYATKVHEFAAGIGERLEAGLQGLRGELESKTGEDRLRVINDVTALVESMTSEFEAFKDEAGTSLEKLATSVDNVGETATLAFQNLDEKYRTAISGTFDYADKRIGETHVKIRQEIVDAIAPVTDKAVETSVAMQAAVAGVQQSISDELEAVKGVLDNTWNTQTNELTRQLRSLDDSQTALRVEVLSRIEAERFDPAAIKDHVATHVAIFEGSMMDAAMAASEAQVVKLLDLATPDLKALARTEAIGAVPAAVAAQTEGLPESVARAVVPLAVAEATRIATEAREAALVAANAAGDALLATVKVEAASIAHAAAQDAAEALREPLLKALDPADLVAKTIHASLPNEVRSAIKEAAEVSEDRLFLKLAAKIQQEVDRIPRPRDGVGKDGEDGEDGKDAHIVTPVAYEIGKRYEHNDWVVHSNGVWMAARSTVSEPSSDSPDWDCLAPGIKNIEGVLAEDGRTVEFHFELTNGDFQKASFKMPIPINRGVFESGRVYERNDQTTFDGSTWIALKDGKLSRPGIDTDWRLVTKRGSNGKDMREGPSPVVRWRGDALAGEKYETNDIVLFAGCNWLAIRSTHDTPPITLVSNETWIKLGS